MDRMDSLINVVRKGDMEAVRALLRDNPEMAIGAQMWENSSPLHLAAQEGYQDIAEVLLSHGAHVNAKSYHNGYRPLHNAALFGKKSLVVLLLSKGSDVNARNDKGETPLHLAVWTGDKEVVEVLLANHANAYITSGDGSYPRGVAIQRGHKDVEELLRQRCEEAREIHEAARDGSLGKITALLKQNPAVVGYSHTDGDTPLLLAVRHGHKDVAEVLLAHGADVSVQDRRGRTPLHGAIDVWLRDPSDRRSQTMVVRYNLSKLLLAHNAPVNAKDEDGETPLYMAAYKADKDLAELLLAHGADINAKNNRAWTPLGL